MVDKDVLSKKLQQIEINFDEFTKMLEEKKKEAENIQDEMKRLQGEYRLIQNLISECEKPVEIEKSEIKEESSPPKTKKG